MKVSQKFVSLTAVLPLTAVVLLSAAVPSQADQCGDGLTLTVRGKNVVCIADSTGTKADNSNGSSTSDSTKPGNNDTGTPAESTPLPSEPAPAVTQIVTVPAPVQTVVVEVPADTPVAQPAGDAKPDATISVSVVPTQSPLTGAAVAPRASTEPSASTSATVAALDLQNASGGFSDYSQIAAPSMFFTGLAGLVVMLVVAKRRKLFPFEARKH